MKFPRHEYIEDIVGDAEYCEGARWRLFEDVDHHFNGGMNLLVQLGDRYTILSIEDFQRMALRVLAQKDR